MKNLELEKILIEFKDEKLTIQEAVTKVTRLFSFSGTLFADETCHCNKPWGVNGRCILCDKPIN